MNLAMKPIKPSKPPFARAPIEAAIEKGLTAVAADIQIDFIQAVETWKTPVAFIIKFSRLEREIYTTNKIFKYVNDSTRAHMIYPKNSGGVLVFQIGGLTIFARRVHHPGFKGKKFTQVIAADWKSKAAPVVQGFLKSI